MRDADPVVIAIVGYRNASDIRTCLDSADAPDRAQFHRLDLREWRPFGVSSADRHALPASSSSAREQLALIEKRITQAASGRLPGGQPVHIYLANDNLGYAGGVNVCLAQLGRAEPWSALWILNPDTEPDPAALTALKDSARARATALSAARLVFKETQRVQSYGGYWRPTDGECPRARHECGA